MYSYQVSSLSILYEFMQCHVGKTKHTSLLEKEKSLVSSRIFPSFHTRLTFKIIYSFPFFIINYSFFKNNLDNNIFCYYES